MESRTLKVFKIGGKVVENPTALNEFLDNFAKISHPKILVHGGGKWVSEMCSKLGIPVQMKDGRRITDSDTLEVVKMMLAGVANKNVVSILQGKGCNAIGLTGADANTIGATKRPIKDGIDFGMVGDVKEINTEVINGLLDMKLTPVFAAMTHDGEGNLFNTNADTIASTVAVGMSRDYQVELAYCLELNGVLRDIRDAKSIIHHIDSASYAELKASGVIHSGMIPKIDNAFDAISNGVHAVRIMNADEIGALMEKDEIGTLIKQ